MSTINAQVLAWIDAAADRKEQIKENKQLFKSIDLDLRGVSNPKIVELLTQYNENAAVWADQDNAFLSYRRPYTEEEQEKEYKARIGNLHYLQNRINKYMVRRQENRTQVELYLKIKELEYILD